MREADEDRLADEEMADVQFDNFWQAGDRAGGLEVEAMPGVTLEAERRGLRGCDAQAAEFLIAPLTLAFGQRVAPGAGVKLDDRRAQRGAGVQRFERRLD